MLVLPPFIGDKNVLPLGYEHVVNWSMSNLDNINVNVSLILGFNLNSLGFDMSEYSKLFSIIDYYSLMWISLFYSFS